MTLTASPATDQFGNLVKPGIPRAPGLLSIGEILQAITTGRLPLRFRAYDGSVFGPQDTSLELEIARPEGLTYLVTAPGDLGLVRAYLTDGLRAHGVHPASPRPMFEALKHFQRYNLHRPSLSNCRKIARSLFPHHAKLLPPPAEEQQPAYQRALRGLRRHSSQRDAETVSYHYNVSNEFYRMVLGPSMTYTCAVFNNQHDSLETAQENKHRLIFDKLNLQPGQVFLDTGCGWGEMLIYAARRGVRGIGVTLSTNQAELATQRIAEAGCSDLAEVRVMDYRDLPERNFDAVTSVGMIEHVGISNYPEYLSTMYDKLTPGGRFLLHCITRPNNPRRKVKAGAFIDRYIFPDGELTGSGEITKLMENTGFEIAHSEDLRDHYAMTLQRWCDNLEDNWDDAVREVGFNKAKLWGLYMGACSHGFHCNDVQIHQFLGVKLDEHGRPADRPVPLRQWWSA